MASWKRETAVSSLLARLSEARRKALHEVEVDGDGLASEFVVLEKKLQHMKESLSNIEKWEGKMADQLGVLDQVVDDEIFNFKLESQVREKKMKQIEEDVGKLESLISTVSQTLGAGLENQGPNDDDDQRRQIIVTANPGVGVVEKNSLILESEAMSSLSASFHCLESSELKTCLLCLSVFPVNMPIKKKPLIYWWIGQGLLTESGQYTAEQVGEQVLRELISEGLIQPITPNSFKVYPTIREMLLIQKNSFIKFNEERNLCRGYRQAPNSSEEEDLVTIFNVKDYNLRRSKTGWDLESKKLEVLQMGRWQDSVTHHIEAEDYEKLLEGLGSQKHLKYLSLRGISRIETLPESIGKLTSLKILDLRACHNLEKLPKATQELKELTHLDVSECFLLDSMPRGLERLTKLQVLKGFVVTNSTRISDLANLPHLKKLSLRVGGNQKLGSLAEFKALRILTISWGEVSLDGTEVLLFLPESLIKLDLRSVPFQALPQWMDNSKVPHLKKLYITGGKLITNNLNFINLYPSIEDKSLRLRYLDSPIKQ